MFDTEFLAGLVKAVLTGRLLVFAGKTFGELSAVVGQQLDDLRGSGGVYTVQEVDTAVPGHVRVDRQEDPESGAVNGDKQVAPRRVYKSGSATPGGNSIKKRFRRW